jgi:hypothetical protein
MNKYLYIYICIHISGMHVHGLKKQFPGSIWIKKFIENNNMYSFFENKLSASAQNTVDPGGRHTDLQGLSSAVL